MSRPAKQRPAHREAWEAVASGPSAEVRAAEPCSASARLVQHRVLALNPETLADTIWLQAASAVAQLAAARQSPPEARHAAALLSLLEASDAGEQMTLPVLALLARWARQQALQPAAARNLDLLHRSLAAAEHHLARTLVPQPGVAPACLLLLGSTAPALAADSEAIGGIVEAAGNALLGSSLGPPLASAAADAMAAVGAVLPCLLVSCAACGRWCGYFFCSAYVQQRLFAVMPHSLLPSHPICCAGQARSVLLATWRAAAVAGRLGSPA